MKSLKRILLTFLTLLSWVAPLNGITVEDVSIIPHSWNHPEQRTGEIALTSLFRDEADYLEEWIEFHRLIGVSHFYLYNNLSQDHYLEVLEPYITSGVVELFDVPFESNNYNDGARTHNFVQVCCYNHAISLAKHNNTWLAIIDSDEFICPAKDLSLSKTLERYSYAGGVVVYWQMYGTSNVWDLEPHELMIEKLLLKAPNDGHHTQFKSIVRPEYAKCQDPHYTTVGKKRLVIPTHQNFSHTRKFNAHPVDILRINHYHFRTESFYWNQKRPRRAQWGDNPSPEEARARIDYHNSEYDPSMLPFVDELKRRLNKE